MTSIITGDIINSREGKPQQWLDALKDTLNNCGSSPKQWEIYRGDSFQLEVQPKKALQAALLIKATMKQFKNIDARLAIGIGEKSYDTERITESNGSAFVNSGECFENLKKNTLAVKTNHLVFDDTINLMLELGLLTMDYWTQTESLIVKTAFENPNYNQEKMAKLLERTQSNISAGLKRAGYDEILKLLSYYENSIDIL